MVNFKLVSYGDDLDFEEEGIYVNGGRKFFYVNGKDYNMKDSERYRNDNRVVFDQKLNVIIFVFGNIYLLEIIMKQKGDIYDSFNRQIDGFNLMVNKVREYEMFQDRVKIYSDDSVILCVSVSGGKLKVIFLNW